MFKIVPHTKPLNHVRWTIIYLLCIILSLMFAPVGKANNECVHDHARIGYWESVRLLPGQVAEVKDDTLTLITRDSLETKVTELKLVADTQYIEQKNGLSCKVARTVLTTHKGMFIVAYCQWCFQVYQITKM